MNEIVNNLLSARDKDKFTPEMHLKQPGFTDLRSTSTGFTSIGIVEHSLKIKKE